jgi:hypothetical protein
MNILITGSSGLIGTAISSKLRKDGHTVFPLLRNQKKGPHYYIQEKNHVHLDSSTSLDAVINLAGSNISQKRWNQKIKLDILESRIKTTQALCIALAELPKKPQILLSASAIGYYGTHPTETFSEFSSAGDDFLAKVAVEWEKATAMAEEVGIRTCHLRFGLVLSPEGGLIKNLLLPFRLATVGIIGSGTQMISWISLVDAVNIMTRLLGKSSFSGPINLVSNQPCSNRELVKLLSSAISRPALPQIPSGIVKFMFGEMAEAALLPSSQVISERIKDLDLDLKHKTLKKCLSQIM